jgi:excisionase family DNA binding protein
MLDMPILCWSGARMALTAAQPQLLTVAQAASLLSVSDRTIRRWIEAERVPYVELPSGGYRIPQGALLASLRGNYDLASELKELDERHQDVSEEQVRSAAGKSD